MHNSHFQESRRLLLSLLSDLRSSLPQNLAYAVPQSLKVYHSTQQIIEYLDQLHDRISDDCSKILITGDVNSGKSTFVNTLLRREIVPDDQQPCTSTFVQVIDARDNGGVEIVHALKTGFTYDITDESTYDSFPLGQLRELAEDEEFAERGYELLKVYCRDCRPNKESLLHNELVRVSLIDSPGLNIDTCKTTCLFTKQQEIDVVCFVVNAENHFTLSVTFADSGPTVP
jgi:mitofusin 2